MLDEDDEEFELDVDVNALDVHIDDEIIEK
jgi:hypothetical protein